jgi:hypothetical protein
MANAMPIGGHSEINFTIAADLSPEQAAAVANGAALLKVVLTVHYKDVFGDEQSHRWCVGYDPDRTNNMSPCKPD